MRDALKMSLLLFESVSDEAFLARGKGKRKLVLHLWPFILEVQDIYEI